MVDTQSQEAAVAARRAPVGVRLAGLLLVAGGLLQLVALGGLISFSSFGAQWAAVVVGVVFYAAAGVVVSLPQLGGAGRRRAGAVALRIFAGASLAIPLLALVGPVMVDPDLEPDELLASSLIGIAGLVLGATAIASAALGIVQLARSGTMPLVAAAVGLVVLAWGAVAGVLSLWIPGITNAEDAMRSMESSASMTRLLPVLIIATGVVWMLARPRRTAPIAAPSKDGGSPGPVGEARS